MARSGIATRFVLALACAGATIAGAQGGGAPDNVTTFWSPMVLEVPAAPIQGMRGGLTWRVADFAGHFCEGASIPEVVVETSGDPEMKLKVHYDVYLDFDAARARKATLLLELLVDGQVVGSVEKKRFHLGAGQRKHVGVKMELNPVDATVFSMGTEPTLRATLSLLD